MHIRTTPVPRHGQEAASLQDRMMQCATMCFSLDSVSAYSVASFEVQGNNVTKLTVEIWAKGSEHRSPTWVLQQEFAAAFLAAIGSPLYDAQNHRLDYNAYLESLGEARALLQVDISGF